MACSYRHTAGGDSLPWADLVESVSNCCPRHPQVTPCTDAGDAIIIDSVRQLEVDIDRLWRLDTSILRCAA